MPHILVIDDEPAIAWSFREFLRDDGYEVTIASSAEEALQVAGRVRPDAVFLDVRLPGMSGLDAIGKLRKKIGAAPIIVMTAFGNLETAVRAVEQGVFDYLPKPFDIDQAGRVLKRALAVHEPQSIDPALPTDASDADLLVGTSQAMQTVFRQIALVAASDAPVLITGESGTGKELVARAIHRNSRRRNGPLMPVCLAALSSAAVESELFGHVRGAFAGADADQVGLLALARGGTVLLDEIGDAPLALQIKILRAIELHQLTPVGAAVPQATDFRVIATTNRRLTDLIEQGEFREDLFFRLSVVRIELPPLRERPDDIPLLARFFLQRFGAPHSQKHFTPAAMCELARRNWQGNVRELKNAVEHAAVMARGDVIDVPELPSSYRSPGDDGRGDAHLQRELQRWVAERLAVLDGEQPESDLFEAMLGAVEPTLLKSVLDHCQNNRAAAARLLGLHRATLRQKLRHYEIDLNDEE